jgi:peptidoglycan/xylan/chitin deacetylase (PgdA/CDA1 family)
LIVTVVTLLIIALAASVVIFAIENNDLKRENERLEQAVLAKQQQAGQVPNGNLASTTTTPTPPNTTAEPPAVTTSPPPPVIPDSEFSHLFPDLYASDTIAERVYIQDDNHIYLTFDDGPTATTSTVLGILDDYGIPATFFVVPREESAGLLRQIHEQGHAIGVHSYSHDYPVIYESVEAFLTDFNRARELIYEQIGIAPDIYRFPGGSANDWNGDVRDDIIAEMNRRGFSHFDWNVQSNDLLPASWDYMYSHIRTEVAKQQRSVVLFHDVPSARYMTWVLGNLFDYFEASERGYIFGKIDKNVRPMQW